MNECVDLASKKHAATCCTSQHLINHGKTLVSRVLPFVLSTVSTLLYLCRQGASNLATGERDTRTRTRAARTGDKIRATAGAVATNTSKMYGVLLAFAVDRR